MLERATDRATEQSNAAAAATSALSAARTATSATIKKTIGLVAAFGSTQLDAELRIIGLGSSASKRRVRASPNPAKSAAPIADS